MKRLEVNEALALAIGHPRSHVITCYDNDSADEDEFRAVYVLLGGEWRLFDYEDPSVIWPIAERFDCFPQRNYAIGKDLLKWAALGKYGLAYCEKTPQLAVASAVIGRTK